MNFLFLLGLALAPGVAISLYIYLKDKHEREPVVLLLASFLYGGISTIVTLLISYPLNSVVTLRQGHIADEFVNAMLIVALVEEFSKFIFVRFILYRDKNFNEPFDGIVYSVMVGMGFATMENIFYIAQYGAATGWLRMFTAVPAHATFAVIMGYFLGRAKFTHRHTFTLSLLSLLAATFIHGMYDYFLFLANAHDMWAWIWIGALIALIIGFVLSRKAIRLHQQASPFIKVSGKDQEKQN